MGQVGTKIKDGFNWIGDKVQQGWGKVKDFGNNAWNTIKNVPVLGKIAEGVEKYTPIGWAATNALKGIDTGISAGSKLLKGDVGGAVQTGIDYGKSALNSENPLLTAIKKVPVIGNIASAAQTAAESVPVFGGMSIGQLKGIGNNALDSAQSFKNGDIKGGFANAGRGLLGAAGGGVLGGRAQQAAGFINKANSVAKVF